MEANVGTFCAKNLFSILHPKYTTKVLLEEQTIEVAQIRMAFTPLIEGEVGTKRADCINPGKSVSAKTWNRWQSMPWINGHHKFWTGQTIPAYLVVVETADKLENVYLLKVEEPKTFLSGEDLNQATHIGTLIKKEGSWACQTLPPPAPEAVYSGDSFTVNEMGQYVGDDGFIVPRNFEEFCLWKPDYVESWVKRRLNKNWVDADVEDWTSDLNLHLAYLPAKSKYRLPGANGKPEGCKDVIMTFDPIRQYGASERRFRHYVNNCLANRFNTIQTNRIKNPVCRVGGMSLTSSIEPEDMDMVDDEYVHSHSTHLSRKARILLRQTEQRLFLDEFFTFVTQEDSSMVPVMNAIQDTGTFGEAQTDLGMSDQEFSRARNRLKQLAVCFEQDQFVPKQRKPYKKRGVASGV